MSLTKGGSHFLFSLPLFFGHLLMVVMYVLCTLVLSFWRFLTDSPLLIKKINIYFPYPLNPQRILSKQWHVKAVAQINSIYIVIITQQLKLLHQLAA